MIYLRYESPSPNARGAHTGVFGLANGLARAGTLSPDDWAWWRANNDWFDEAYPDPGKADPTLFDKSVHPVTACWFKPTATHLLERVPGYLALLDRYGVACVERTSTAPGRVLYEDDVQIVVAA
ncbi:hypothetical protein NLX83_36765 [Allokutzneria sp. A3M-2-11 16]|uniref:hypothetical protein n=1 Tax=Allokutzneria sp. A3M-2-11 16 TaxID=2962043 RepID=UPI0020B7F29B|nr:hypothetical protein [Allokutzneria sp. A3M-2-11 16]MCP3804834.1 hypothetical protein [Allokutzneria sp. A3M-2-11 16]